MKRMSTKTYIITNIEHIVKIGTELTLSWFRGQPEVFGNLTPKIFRHPMFSRNSNDLEYSFITNFKLEAPSLYSKVPRHDNDHLAWLFLAQHHGLPTRLLDWTVSVLIASFFAVREHFDKDGELWAMNPIRLNCCSGHTSIAIPDDPEVRFFASEPYQSYSPHLAKELKLENPPQRPKAFFPPMNFPRMVAQLSRFTIHPTPKQNNAITDLLTDEQYLVHYIIPSDKKKKILEDLDALGISKTTLFPNLDSLSEDIIQRHCNPPQAFEFQNPPKCAGEYSCP